MKTVKILYTEGNGSFEEKDFELPNIQDNEIRVQAKMTGALQSWSLLTANCVAALRSKLKSDG